MTNSWVFERLRSVPLFRELSDEELTSIVAISQVRTYQPKSYVFMQGDMLETYISSIQERLKYIKRTEMEKNKSFPSCRMEKCFPIPDFFAKDLTLLMQKLWKNLH